MAFLGNNVYDSGLNYLTSNVTTLHILQGASDPATYSDVTTNTLGNSAVTVGAAGVRSPNGRKVTVPAISAGTVTGTGTATRYALVKTATSELIAAGVLSASQAVTSGNTFTLTTFDIGIPAP